MLQLEYGFCLVSQSVIFKCICNIIRDISPLSMCTHMLSGGESFITCVWAYLEKGIHSLVCQHKLSQLWLFGNVDISKGNICCVKMTFFLFITIFLYKNSVFVNFSVTLGEYFPNIKDLWLSTHRYPWCHSLICLLYHHTKLPFWQGWKHSGNIFQFFFMWYTITNSNWRFWIPFCWLVRVSLVIEMRGTEDYRNIPWHFYDK